MLENAEGHLNGLSISVNLETYMGDGVFLKHSVTSKLGDIILIFLQPS